MAATLRFRAPDRHGEVLAVPPFDELPAQIAANRRRLNDATVAIDGVPLGEFRAQTRSEIVALGEPCSGDESFSSDGPLILSGHQPELFHPGVWVKNFALHGLARRVGGISLNLIVDNDTIKSTALRVPVFRDADPDSVHLETVPFDVLAGETTFEDATIQDRDLFRSFPSRVAALTRNWGYVPLLPSVWRVERTLDESFVAMRRDCELAWGCRNREVRVSRLARTDAFARFARHILADLSRFRDVYNAALRRYRRDNGIRSQSHPAPDLRPDEAPFWVHDHGARQRATRASDVHTLRPRALTLTLFARVCLGDFFIHGIGGGKYDEVTDTIVRDYFNIEPPAYQVLSATLHLPLPAYPATHHDLERAVRLLRELEWQPERHLARASLEVADLRQAADEKEHLIRSEPPQCDRAARRRWFHALQDATARLRAGAADQVSPADAAFQRLAADVHANRVLKRRDFAWVLYPEEALRSFFQRFA